MTHRYSTVLAALAFAQGMAFSMNTPWAAPRDEMPDARGAMVDIDQDEELKEYRMVMMIDHEHVMPACSSIIYLSQEFKGNLVFDVFLASDIETNEKFDTGDLRTLIGSLSTGMASSSSRPSPRNILRYKREMHFNVGEGDLPENIRQLFEGDPRLDIELNNPNLGAFYAHLFGKMRTIHTFAYLPVRSIVDVDIKQALDDAVNDPQGTNHGYFTTSVLTLENGNLGYNIPYNPNAYQQHVIVFH